MPDGIETEARERMDVRLIYQAADMDATAPVIFLVGENADRSEWLVRAVRKAGWRCALAVAPVADWNRQLSPWPATAVFRGGEDFAGEADAFLDALAKQIPDVLAQAGGKRACLCGYSLAGLFVLYAAAKLRLDRVAALSPSVWYEDFVGYFAQHLPPRETKVYLSLGRKEEKTGNARLRSVGENLRAVQALLGDDTPLVMHDGGHYTDVEKRMQHALEWIITGENR